MALSGTLADIGIVELIQFPSNGRKTGELILAGTDEEARLYYVDGALVHTMVGERTGMEGLVEVVAWNTGEFEFRMGVENDQRTIDLDLHRALMLALKTRDERAENARKSNGKDEAQDVDEIPSKTTALLKEMVSSNEALSGAYVVTADGNILARADADSSTETDDFQALLSQLAALYETYQRPKLGRVFLDDDEGILHGARISPSHIAVISASKDASMGVVSMLMNKLLSGMVGMR